MRFLPNQTIKHGGNLYEADNEYDIPEAEAKFMVSHGWGSAPDLKPEPGAWSDPVTITTPPADHAVLQPHDSAIGQDSRV